MAADERLICASGDLRDGGDGVRFAVTYENVEHPAFVVRYAGKVHAYVNRCTHRRVELDWMPGRFFDVERRFLICATHGALYHPETGACLGGPCAGGLVKLPVIEKNSGVYLVAAGTSLEPNT